MLLSDVCFLKSTTGLWPQLPALAGIVNMLIYAQNLASHITHFAHRFDCSGMIPRFSKLIQIFLGPGNTHSQEWGMPPPPHPGHMSVIEEFGGGERVKSLFLLSENRLLTRGLPMDHGSGVYGSVGGKPEEEG